MARYDDTFVDRFLGPWNRHDVDGALALMTDDCVWDVTKRPRDAWHPLHRADGPPLRDRGGV
jgi:ketosteroid isomerase-like protein